MPEPTATGSTLTAADVMTVRPLCCNATSSVIEAVRIFREADCGAVPVFDGGKLVGVLTDRDVALALTEHDRDLLALPVGEITTPGVVSVGPGMPLDSVATMFADRGVRRVLVVDDLGNLLGIIGWADLAPHITDAKVGRAMTRVVAKP